MQRSAVSEQWRKIHHPLPSSLEGTKTASLINSINDRYSFFETLFLTEREATSKNMKVCFESLSSEFISLFTRQNQLLYHKSPGSAV